MIPTFTRPQILDTLRGLNEEIQSIRQEIQGWEDLLRQLDRLPTVTIQSNPPEVQVDAP